MTKHGVFQQSIAFTEQLERLLLIFGGHPFGPRTRRRRLSLAAASRCLGLRLRGLPRLLLGTSCLRRRFAGGIFIIGCVSRLLPGRSIFVLFA